MFAIESTVSRLRVLAVLIPLASAACAQDGAVADMTDPRDALDGRGDALVANDGEASVDAAVDAIGDARSSDDPWAFTVGLPNGPQCAQILYCYLEHHCTDQPCYDACNSAPHPSPWPLALAAAECVFQEASQAPCSVACGWAPGAGESCQQCLYGRCVGTSQTTTCDDARCTTTAARYVCSGGPCSDAFNAFVDGPLDGGT